MIRQLSISRLALVGALALLLCFYGLNTTQEHARRSLLVVEEEEPLLLSNRIRMLKANPNNNIESKDVKSKQYGRYDRPRRLESLEIALGNSDELAEAVLTVQSPTKKIAPYIEASVSKLLATTIEMIDTAKILLKNQNTLADGRKLMEKANAFYRSAMSKIQNDREQWGQDNTDNEESTLDDDEKAALLTRRLYQTLITFPECLQMLFQDCLEVINNDIANIGLGTIEVVVHEKRNGDQEGYNKVVIVTNELADRVVGRNGDGIVTYPFLWNDSQTGPRALGVDGKWNCHDKSPEHCCDEIKEGAPNPDKNGNYIECHMFVPYGGIGKPRRNDRVFITLSPDGRVHEPPIIQ